jgi:acyl-[acyl carrier protein]--UDP-N-acetylglucosamine O-acyltransferase
VLDYINFGSSVSIRSCARLGTKASVMDFFHLGSSLSLRKFARVGSGMSVTGQTRGFNKTISIVDFVNFGSSLSMRSHARAGDKLSVLDFLALGSALSMRSYTRIGSAFSVHGVAILGSVQKLSVINIAHMGSSISLRNFARFASHASIVDFMSLGSSLSLRKFTRAGSSLSVAGTAVSRVGSSISVMNLCHFGSSLSVRTHIRAGSRISVFDWMALGSTLSVRSFTRFGSSMSVVSAATGRFDCNSLSVVQQAFIGSSLSIRSFARVGSATSVLSFAHLGSAISLRSFSRMSSTVSVLDFSSFGSTLSMRSFCRIGSSLSIYGESTTVSRLQIGGAELLDNPAHAKSQTSIKIKKTAAGTDWGTPITMGYDTGEPDQEGQLHGKWVLVGGVGSLSDQRYKTAITPLFEEMVGSYRSRSRKNVEPSSDKRYKSFSSAGDTITYNTTIVDGAATRESDSDTQLTRDEATMDMIRKLSPVSYKYKNTAESKYSRFGFIAQEMQQILPDVVRESVETADPLSPTKHKAIRYGDLVAVLTMGIQSMDRVSEGLELELSKLEARVDMDYGADLDPKLRLLEEIVVRHIVEKIAFEETVVGDLLAKDEDEVAQMDEKAIEDMLQKLNATAEAVLREEDEYAHVPRRWDVDA